MQLPFSYFMSSASYLSLISHTVALHSSMKRKAGLLPRVRAQGVKPANVLLPSFLTSSDLQTATSGGVSGILGLSCRENPLILALLVPVLSFRCCTRDLPWQTRVSISVCSVSKEDSCNRWIREVSGADSMIALP